MGIVVGKNGSRIIESCDIGRVTKPGSPPMANNPDIQHLPSHACEDSNDVVTKPERTPSADNDFSIDPSPVISRDSYGAMMKASFDRELKNFNEHKGNKA